MAVVGPRRRQDPILRRTLGRRCRWTSLTQQALRMRHFRWSICAIKPMMRCCFAADCEHSPVRNKAGWSLGWVSALDCEGWTIWIVDARRDDGKRYVVHADEILTGFLELAPPASNLACYETGLATQFTPQGSHAEQSETKQRNCRAPIGNTHYARSGLDDMSCLNRLDKKNRGYCGQKEQER